MPNHKSQFTNPPDIGLPIGNLTSQFLSNVYLNELDQFVKHGLKCRHYLRYVDDFVLLADEPGQLTTRRQDIAGFLDRRLKLRLKSEGIVLRVADGVDLLGYIVRPRYILARRRVVNSLKSRLSILEQYLLTRFVINGRTYARLAMPQEKVGELRQTVSSYLGHFKHAQTWNLLQKIWARFDWLREYFFLVDGRLLDRFRYQSTFRSSQAQLHFFRYRLGQTVVLLVRVGKFYVLHGLDARKLAPLLGLNINSDQYAGAVCAGFPAWMQKRYLEKLLSAGVSVAVLEEQGPGRFITERRVDTIYHFGGTLCAG